MKILFINNDGSGFADQIDITEGLTVSVLFEQRMPHGSPQDYLIRVNRQPTTADYVLQEEDRVSITPTKIEGADLDIKLCIPILHWKGASWEPDNDSIVSICSVS
ncbi:hypothetical protein [Gimesia fumaroli]|uniref:ThiS family protein n=1 Tax=Gimesia fumaroli TaxID=2527976 RepID=A0A518IGD9_9PLAN|nr:hypothetical protein [Gimesia fumaroli]QDV52156.1 hypothetical protein Enr17x_42160 [Gimesia fumaroli]